MKSLTFHFLAKIEAAQVVPYIHPGNKLATLVGLEQGRGRTGWQGHCHAGCCHEPGCVDKSDVSAEMIEHEKEIGREQARNEGKAENMLEKIAEGKLNKFFKESTLLNQEFTKDNTKTVRQYLQGIDKDLTVTSFVRYTLNQ